MKTLSASKKIKQRLSCLLTCLLILGTVLPVSAAQQDAQTIVTAAVDASAGSMYDRQPPTLIIDGTGLNGSGITATHGNAGDAHGIWHTNANPAENAWVQIDLGKVVSLAQMYVWNMNQQGNTARGFKNVKIEYSRDAASWQTLTPAAGMTFKDNNADYPFQFAQASGEENIAATNLNDGTNSPIDFGGASARYVKLTAAPTAGDGSWGDIYFGLSEVCFTSYLSADTVLTEAITVEGANHTTSITTNGGSLQMQAIIAPENATTKDVSWSVIGADGNATTLATISADGLLTAKDNGLVTVIATATDGSGVHGQATIKITGQPVIITNVQAASGNDYATAQSAARTVDGSGMSGNLSIRDVHDSHIFGETMWHTGANPGNTAWIEFDLGEITAIDEMYIWNMNQQGNTIRGLKNIKIEYSENGTAWQALAPAAGMNFTDANANYPFQLAQAIGQDNMPATNLNDGQSSPVSFGGLRARYVKLTAAPTAGDGSWGDIYFGLSEVRFTKAVADDTVLIEEITVTGANGATAITKKGGSLQMQAVITPENATTQDVIWSVVGTDGNTTALANISADGLLSAKDNGSVTVIATATDGSGVRGQATVTITGQPIVITNVQAVAGNQYDETLTAERTVDSSGMSGTSSILDTHDNHHWAETMWHTDANPGDTAWIEFDLGAVKSIDEMYVWNLNELDKTERGIKDIKIEYKANKSDAWTELRGADAGTGDYPYTLAKADGSAQMPATNLVSGKPVQFGVKAQYVRITAGSSWGDVYWGLSEVRFTELPPDYSALVDIDVPGFAVTPALTAGELDITWSVTVDSAAGIDLDTVNKLATFTEYGVIYATDKTQTEKLLNGEATDYAKVMKFDSGTDIDVYTQFSFRLMGVDAGVSRTAMFYVTYKCADVSYTVYSDCVLVATDSID